MDRIDHRITIDLATWRCAISTHAKPDGQHTFTLKAARNLGTSLSNAIRDQRARAIDMAGMDPALADAPWPAVLQHIDADLDTLVDNMCRAVLDADVDALDRTTDPADLGPTPTLHDDGRVIALASFDDGWIQVQR